MPTITHPDLGEATCSESAVRVHERNGWKRVAAKKADAKPSTSTKASTAVADTTPDNKES